MIDSQECYYCGDGVEKSAAGEWQHSEDLGIDVAGKRVVSTCEWGKPYPRSSVGDCDE